MTQETSAPQDRPERQDAPVTGDVTGQAAPTSDEVDRSRDDWQRTQNTAGTHPGAAAGWLVLMGLLLGGFALMGAAFAHGSGALFVGGLLVTGLAFVVPLGVVGRAER